MNLEKVLGTLAAEFQREKIDFALIGGLALAFAGVKRATEDIDFMVLLSDGKKAEQIMKSLGYVPLHQTENVASYSGLNGLCQVDFLFAHRTYSMRMLRNASMQNVFGFQIKVIRPEDIIGLKVQSMVNDKNRLERDLSDIKEILRANRGNLDLPMIREYFQLFERESELENLLSQTK